MESRRNTRTSNTRNNNSRSTSGSKKDKALVAVLSGLTSNQSGEIMREFMKAKDKYAPNARGTIATGRQKDVGNMIQGKSGGRKKGIPQKS